MVISQPLSGSMQARSLKGALGPEAPPFQIKGPQFLPKRV